MTTKLRKKQKLRNNEYYNTQEIFDDLYYKAKNKKKYKFYKLLDLITDEKNIELAYRNIKKNTGSKTSGVNKLDIEHLAKMTNNNLINYVRNRLENFQPQKIKRVEIPKSNGKMRPLGIPTIEDRLLQQCIKQVLEPICEAKFYKHSYGFRPNRNTKHAIARVSVLANKNYHFVVDIDIQGFFDNVNHGKLIKQIWSLGIRDKQLLCIISKMLKSPIEGLGIQNKGIPQGGILSPLLSNIVLNELDWWIANQWSNFNTKYQYKRDTDKYTALRKRTNLKEIHLVRYADDFKILCKDYKTANKIYNATKMWLKERLKLNISKEKSKVINLTKSTSEFLGFKIKLFSKGTKKVVKTNISNKAKEKIVKQLKDQIKRIKENPTIENVNKYNSMVLGIHNYYKIATRVNIDFQKIAYILDKVIYNRTKNIQSKTGTKSECYKKFYNRYNLKVVYIQKIALFPIAGVRNKIPTNFQQKICNYTKIGRMLIHDRLEYISVETLRYIMSNPITYKSIEYNDNRISLYVGQGGKCFITGDLLEINDMECHHKIPKSKGGNDKYSNLVFLKKEIHKLIHATSQEIIEKYLFKLNLNKKALKEVNNLRFLVGNFEI
ncbi:group II intron reverse transcriptase/maturase [Clostridium perfringens]|nr:group II intron reverse transcriptase/maturase [Clostridium perfringens]